MEWKLIRKESNDGINNDNDFGKKESKSGRGNRSSVARNRLYGNTDKLGSQTHV